MREPADRRNRRRRTLGALLAERGAVLIDAPVSGAEPRAITATLTIMIGGSDKDAIERIKPVLLTMGNRCSRPARLARATP